MDANVDVCAHTRLPTDWILFNRQKNNKKQYLTIVFALHSIGFYVLTPFVLLCELKTFFPRNLTREMCLNFCRIFSLWFLFVVFRTRKCRHRRSHLPVRAAEHNRDAVSSISRCNRWTYDFRFFFLLSSTSEGKRDRRKAKPQKVSVRASDFVQQGEGVFVHRVNHFVSICLACVERVRSQNTINIRRMNDHAEKTINNRQTALIINCCSF